MDKRIMVVDDDPDILIAIRKIFEREGYEVFTVDSGMDCISEIERGFKGVILMDIMMPEMDGYTLTAEVKSRPKLTDLHVILHTSLSGVFNHAMVEKVGADDFIAKFNPDELAGAVQKWLHAD